ncbi:OLC1v1032930C1 [Oldenlandia corymbosa var. corymbosa]|uniref:OLC1v1032930C1 n=1 Tax=Oldenlandia corymbosa var. corymbosa TaxID=529605 RepID=A0AAV1CNK3_OLDCO|nr:OLC1v1032930C1 [Oldenlandia corymbosa var. corymbosa]
MAASSTVAFLVFISLLAIAASQIESPSPIYPPPSPVFPPPPPPPPQALVNAVETLSNSGYTAMALTLKLILEQPQFMSLPSSLTIFAPPDSAFADSGQPTLSLLLLHFSPLSLSFQSLASLPFSSTIPTLSRTPSPLFVTTPPSEPTKISINSVNISGSPLYDDGSVVIFAVEKFFEPNFTVSTPGVTPTLDLECVKFTSFSRYLDASGILKSRGHALMATFLDLQLMGFVGSGTEMKLTVFAPSDEALIDDFGNVLEYRSMFLRHLLPCKFNWVQLNGITNGTVFANYVEGLSMKITRSDNSVMVNGVKINAPDIYENEYIAIHGVEKQIPVFDSSEEEEFEEISMVKFAKKIEKRQCPAPDRSEF